MFNGEIVPKTFSTWTSICVALGLSCDVFVKCSLESQHAGPCMFHMSEHQQVEADLEVECSRTCRMLRT